MVSHKKYVRIKTKIDLPGNMFGDPNVVNDHFLNTPGENSIRLSQLTFLEFNRAISDDNSFNIQQVNEIDILKILKSLKSNAVGLDGISLDMILSTLPYSLSAITAIMNRSIETGVFPRNWQEALIKPIPKKSLPSSLSDLRPVSILPCMSKIVERVVADQMRLFLEKNDILPRKHYSLKI